MPFRHKAFNGLWTIGDWADHFAFVCPFITKYGEHCPCTYGGALTKNYRHDWDTLRRCNACTLYRNRGIDD